LADEDMMPYRYAYEVDNTEQIYGVVILQLLQSKLKYPLIRQALLTAGIACRRPVPWWTTF
jgi:hypothetical protein